MIRLLRTDGIEILLNTETIKNIQGRKDKPTTITFTNDDTVDVKNQVFDITQKIKAYVSGITQERKDFDKAVKEKEKEKSKTKPKEKEEFEKVAEEQVEAANGLKPAEANQGNVAEANVADGNVAEEPEPNPGDPANPPETDKKKV
ncbi:MAG: flagellar FlbD family protein [bacterium]|nr:flagellar FlbD family protein [bacterium]